MNRKEFLKRLAFGSIGLAIAPGILAKTTADKPAASLTIGKGEGILNLNTNPIKLKLKNTSSETIYDIELFNANKNLFQKNFLHPEIGFKCSKADGSGNSKINYLELLHQTNCQPLNIPVIYIKSVNPKTSCRSRFDIKEVKYDPAKPSTPERTRYIWGYFSPMQLNANECIVKLNDNRGIRLCGLTGIVIPRLESQAEIELHFYTQQMLDKMPVSDMFSQGFDEQFLEISKPPYF